MSQRQGIRLTRNEDITTQHFIYYSQMCSIAMLNGNAWFAVSTMSKIRHVNNDISSIDSIIKDERTPGLFRCKY